MARSFLDTTWTRRRASPDTVDFAREHALYIAAFNHLTPFPGTPLYQRLKEQGRLLYENWWLDDRYSYNRIPFQPKGMSPELLQRNCVEARRKFYSWPSIFQRGADRVNRNNWFMWRNFYLINAMHRNDVSMRDHYPLGDESWQGAVIESQLSASRPGRVQFDLANAEDDAGIRRLLRANPMPGTITISLEREPGYFADAALPGGGKQTIVGA